MIAPNKQPEPEPDPAGGMGGLFSEVQQQAGGLRHLRSDARMVARLISCGVIEEEQAAELLKQGFKLAAKSARKGDARGYAATMGIAIAAVKLEQAELQSKAPALVRHEHHHSGTVNLQALRQEVLNEPSYLEYSRAAEANGDPGVLCQDDQPGQVANGKAPGASGQGANGHSSGEN